MLGGNVIERDELGLDGLQLASDSIGQRSQFMSRDAAALEPVHRRVIRARRSFLAFSDPSHFVGNICQPTQRRRKNDHDRHGSGEHRSHSANRRFLCNDSPGHQDPACEFDHQPDAHRLADQAFRQRVVQDETTTPGQNPLRTATGTVNVER